MSECCMWLNEENFDCQNPHSKHHRKPCVGRNCQDSDDGFGNIKDDDDIDLSGEYPNGTEPDNYDYWESNDPDPTN